MLIRAVTCLFAAVIAIAVAGYIAWTATGETPSALNAELHPVEVLRAIAQQAATTAPFLEWNVPLWSIFVWLLWLLGIHGLGILALAILKPGTPGSACTMGVIAFSVGFVAYSMLQLVIGLAGAAKLPLIFPVFAMGAIAFFIGPFRRNSLQMPRAAVWQWRSLPRFHKVLVALFVALVCLLLVPALTPPAQSDGLRYHLGAVQEYLKLGRITYLPLNAYSNMPFLVEMHFMGALACKAPEASQLMHLTIALYTAAGVYALLLRLSPSIISQPPNRMLYLLPALLYISTPMSAVLATWPFTDHGIALFLVVTVLVSITYFSNLQEKRNWLLLGLLCGGLIGTKYTMAPVAVAVLAIPLLRKRDSGLRLIGTNLTAVFTGLFIMGLVGGTWYLKNLVFTGNPFYPLGSRWLPGGEWSTANDFFLQARAGAKGLGKSLADLVMLPWNATLHWIRFEAHNPGMSFIIAVISALTGLTATSNLRLNRDRQLIFAVMFLTFLIWFFSYQGNRLLLPTLALALSLSPLHLFDHYRVCRTIYSAGLVFASAFGLLWAVQWSWVTTALTPPPLPYLLGAQDHGTYRYQAITNARAYDFLNQRVGKDEQVLLVGEHRIFGAEFQAIWSDWFDTPALVHLLREQNINSTSELLDYLRSQNIRWVMINEAELAPQLERDFRPWFKPHEWQVFQDIRILKDTDVQTFQLPPGVIVHRLNGPAR